MPASAAPKLATAIQPYVLRFDNNDVERRRHKNDLILVSQSPNESAQMVVVRTGKICLLCRRKNRYWVRLATGQRTTGEGAVGGHCVGVLPSALD